MTPPPKVRVLFVCLGNACRSSMAESIARKDASDIIEAASAGLYPLGRVVDLTQQTLLGNGYSTDALASKPIRRSAVKGADLIINLSGTSLASLFEDEPQPLRSADSSARTPTLEDWQVADPYGEDPATYQRILEEIAYRVRRLAERLRKERRSSSK